MFKSEYLLIQCRVYDKRIVQKYNFNSGKSFCTEVLILFSFLFVKLYTTNSYTRQTFLGVFSRESYILKTVLEYHYCLSKFRVDKDKCQDIEKNNIRIPLKSRSLRPTLTSWTDKHKVLVISVVSFSQSSFIWYSLSSSTKKRKFYPKNKHVIK